MAKRAGGVGPPPPQPPLVPVKARAGLSKAALPRRTTSQEDAGHRPAPREGAQRPGPAIPKASPSPAAQSGMG